MPHTNTTSTIELPIFVDSDIPSWIQDWNEAMNKIDDSYLTHANTINSLGSAVESLQDSVQGTASEPGLEQIVNAPTTGLVDRVTKLEQGDSYGQSPLVIGCDSSDYLGIDFPEDTLGVKAVGIHSMLLFSKPKIDTAQDITTFNYIRGFANFGALAGKWSVTNLGGEQNYVIIGIFEGNIFNLVPEPFPGDELEIGNVSSMNSIKIGYVQTDSGIELGEIYAFYTGKTTVMFQPDNTALPATGNKWFYGIGSIIGGIPIDTEALEVGIKRNK